MFKRLVLSNLNVAVEEFLDPFRFACRAKRSVEKMLFYYVFNSVYAHLDKLNTNLRFMIMFLFFHGGQYEVDIFQMLSV